MESEKKIKQLLLSVEKPGRYAGKEINSIIKNNYAVRFVLCYPDLYEIGMSNNGIQILYSLINSVEDVWGERVFAAAPDFYDLLKKNEIPLFSLESRLPVKDADILGFNLSHELLYTTMLQVLDLSGIPLKSCERKEGDPVVISAGEAVSNPAPVYQFSDLIFAGEGEDAVVEISQIVKRLKSDGVSRKEIIERLSAIDGMINSGKLETKINNDGILSFDEKLFKKRVFRGSKPLIPLKPIVSNLRITQDRAIVEVTKGCYNLCKFCHAGYYNLPCRMYDPHDAAETAKTLLKNTGMDGISFNSLSISDYKYLTDLLNEIVPFLNENGASISLPSMKVDMATLPIIKSISDVRMTSVTFAVESANDDIRKIIHKRVITDELLEIVKDLFSSGWKTVKLYFMLGLPGYKEHDEVMPIINLLEKINHIGQRKKSINVTVSPFVPKPHTPFESSEMAPREYFEKCVATLKRILPRNISIKNHNLEMSEIEGVLSRGDRLIGDVIFEVYRRGSFLDSWDEYIKFDVWRDVFEDLGIDRRKYLKERHDTRHPWKILDCENEAVISNRASKVLNDSELKSNRARFIALIDEAAFKASREKFEIEKSVFFSKLRFYYSKTGEMIYYSHLDIMEIFKRALRRSEVPVSFSQGFNKREIFHSGFPIPLGVESTCEYVDVDIYRDCETAGMQERINKCMPEGLRISGIIKNPPKVPSCDNIFRYTIKRDDFDFSGMKENIERGVTFNKKTKKGIIPIDIRNSIYGSDITEKSAVLDLYIGRTESVRIDSMIESLTSETPFMFEIRKIAHFLLTGDGIVPF